MFVGMMRFTQNFDIDFLRGSAGTKAVELRLGILEGLVSLGHTPVILNNVPKDQQFLLDGGRVDGYNYDFMKDVAYCPLEIPQMDLLIVEGSVDNIQFGINPIKRFVEVLKKYGGPAVAYHHGDQNCSVPIGEIYRAEKNGPDPIHPDNVLYRNVFQGIPWRSSQWQLWTPGDPSKLRNLKSERRGYNLIPEGRSKRFKLGYSPTFDVVRCRWEDKSDFVYVGAERNGSRRDRISQLYNGQSKCARCVDDGIHKLLYGNWAEPLEQFDYRGFVPGFGMVYSILPMAEATIAITDDWFVNQGMITTRVIQGVRAGLLTLADRNMKPDILDYLPEDNLVSTHDEVHQKYDWWQKKTFAEKNKFRATQMGMLKPWSFRLAEMGL